MNITFHQMTTLVAVIEHGNIKAGANSLHKTHPSVITALKKLESELGFSLFDRSGYRSTPTDRGMVFYRRCKQVLNEVEDLKNLSHHLQKNKNTEISIAIGDVTPLEPALRLLRKFTEKNKFTHLNLLFENIEGANERLLEGETSLIIHHIDKSDIRYEHKDFCSIKIIPVVAEGFLNIPLTNKLKYTDLRNYNQCIIRSTAKTILTKDHFILNQSPSITVGDQYTKKEIIVQKMAWGHMPLFLIEEELKQGKLISIEGEFIKSSTLDIVIARLHNDNHDQMEELLWEIFD